MIYLIEEQINAIHSGEVVPGYEGYSIEVNTDDCRYDRTANMNYDFEINLYKDGELFGIAVGGYDDGNGIEFNESLYFKETTIIDKFLLELSKEGISLSEKLEKLENYIKDLGISKN